MWFEIWKGRQKSSPKGRFEPGSIGQKEYAMTRALLSARWS